MGATRLIEHEAVVKESGHGLLRIALNPGSACKGCHAEGVCNPSGQSEKIIDIKGRYFYKTGDKVTVLMKMRTGYTAVFLGYILPLLVVITVLATGSILSMSEPLIAVSALLFLALYYLLLFLMRERINKKFTFSIKP